MSPYELAAVVIAFAILVSTLTAFAYVSLRFAMMALSMDAALLREFKVASKHIADISQSNREILNSSGENLQTKLRDFVASRMSPTEGEFIHQTDEEAWLAEQLNNARAEGMSKEEIQAFVSQAIGADVDEDLIPDEEVDRNAV